MCAQGSPKYLNLCIYYFRIQICRNDVDFIKAISLTSLELGFDAAH